MIQCFQSNFTIFSCHDARGTQFNVQAHPSLHSSGHVPTKPTNFAVSQLPIESSAKLLLNEINKLQIEDRDDGLFKILNILKTDRTVS